MICFSKLNITHGSVAFKKVQTANTVATNNFFFDLLNAFLKYV